MGKVITVWGSPGSGKSMFCCILAKALTRDKRKAIEIWQSKPYTLRSAGLNEGQTAATAVVQSSC